MTDRQIRHSRRARAAAGFTLVELLVALVIVGLVTGYALQSLSGALARLSRSRHTADAMLLAQSMLARVGQDIAFSREVSGEAPGGYSWAVQSTPFTVIRVPAQTGVTGYTVLVTVGWRQGGQPRSIEISTVRLAYRSPGS